MELKFYYKADQFSQIYQDFKQFQENKQKLVQEVETFFERLGMKGFKWRVLNGELLIDSCMYEKIPSEIKKQLRPYGKFSSIKSVYTTRSDSELIKEWKSFCELNDIHLLERRFDVMNYFDCPLNESTVSLVHSNELETLFIKINYKVSLYSLAKNLSILNVSPICYGIEEIDGATYDEISETEGSELIAPWSFNSTRLTGLI